MKYTTISMSEKELLKYVITRAPSLGNILEKYGETSLYDYGQSHYNQTPARGQRQKELVDLLVNSVKHKHPSIAINVRQGLENNFCVSTAEHHGPM